MPKLQLSLAIWFILFFNSWVFWGSRQKQTARQRSRAWWPPLSRTWTSFRPYFLLLWSERVGHQVYINNSGFLLWATVFNVTFLSTLLPLIAMSFGNQCWVIILLLFKILRIVGGTGGDDDTDGGGGDYLTFLEHLLCTRLYVKCFLWIIMFTPQHFFIRQSLNNLVKGHVSYKWQIL